jgi:hypothetical protein
MKVKSQLLAVGITLFLPATLSAQRPRLAGFQMSAHAAGFANDSSARRTTWGAGIGGSLGFGITEQLAIFLGVGVGGLDTGNGGAMLAYADFGLRVLPARIGRVAPYAEVMYTARGRDVAPDRQVTSTGASLGLGMEVWLRRGLSLDAAIVRMRGTYREDFRARPIPVPFTETTRRLQLGVTWRAPVDGPTRPAVEQLSR